MIARFGSLPRPASWRRHPVAVAALLLPLVFLVPPLVLDETRYLAVAWAMFRDGSFLVPQLGGMAYTHKPPLLFWLVAASWEVTGVHAWTARAVTVGCSLASLLLLHRLALRLGASREAALLATWVLLGTCYFALFAGAIMFDVALATCVLLALHGLCDLACGRGPWLAGVALGLGILVKGPVMLLDVAGAAVAAPWWLGARLGVARSRYWKGLVAALLLGTGIALAWAIPAALEGGGDYARAIFLEQTLDRIEGVEESRAHGRPWWWYLPLLPLLLLPWPLVLAGSWRRLPALADTAAVRLLLAWCLPTLAAFSLVSGKQAHYLLPLFPGVALALAAGLDRGALVLRAWPWALLLAVLGAGVALAPLLSAGLPPWEARTPAWGLMLAGAGLLLAWRWRSGATPAAVALSCLLAVLVLKLAFAFGPVARYDIGPAARELRAALDRGQPVANLGWPHGAWDFAARLAQPLPNLFDPDSIRNWAVAHPGGMLVSFSRNFRVRAQPLYEQAFRGGHLRMWNARDALDHGVDAAPGARDAEMAGED